tara:strand:- start:13784 stop:14872 length:1089 start_codon:yes stop_codon:yes gene_type:complete
MTEQTKRVFFTGGGTGGHIYPAVAVADELTSLDPKVEVHFVGANRPLDQKILSRIEYPTHTISIMPINTGNLLKKILGLLVLPYAFIEALFLLIKYRPQLVVGYGGYASFPSLYAAYFLSIPIMLWEPNAKAGLVTRVMADKAKQIFVNLRSKDEIFEKYNVQEVGVPTRFQRAVRNSAQKKFRVFIFGGSSGSRSINEKVYELLEKVNRDKDHPLRELEFLHQIGSLDFEKFQALYKGFDISLEVREFVHNMSEELARADLLICRAGASTIAEVCISQKAAIFVPLPWAADNHQFENAKQLAQAQAAILLEQKDLNVDHLESLILGFVENPDLLAMLEKNVERFAKPHASSDMAKKILLSL